MPRTDRKQNAVSTCQIAIHHTAPAATAMISKAQTIDIAATIEAKSWCESRRMSSRAAPLAGNSAYQHDSSSRVDRIEMESQFVLLKKCMLLWVEEVAARFKFNRHENRPGLPYGRSV